MEGGRPQAQGATASPIAVVLNWNAGLRSELHDRSGHPPKGVVCLRELGSAVTYALLEFFVRTFQHLLHKSAFADVPRNLRCPMMFPWESLVARPSTKSAPGGRPWSGVRFRSGRSSNLGEDERADPVIRKNSIPRKLGEFCGLPRALRYGIRSTRRRRSPARGTTRRAQRCPSRPRRVVPRKSLSREASDALIQG